MNEQNREEFFLIWGQALELYGKPSSAAALEMTFALLKKFSLEQVKTALISHMQDPTAGQFMPKPADIFRQIEGTKADRAQQAWVYVSQAIRGSSARFIRMTDQIAMQVVQDMGGLGHLGRTNEADLPYRQKEFVERYQSYEGRALPPMAPIRLLANPGVEAETYSFFGPQDEVEKLVALTYQPQGEAA